MSHQLKVIISVQLIFWFVCRSSCSSNHQQHQHRVESPFVDVPPNVFAPRGRLYKVEDAVHTITSSEEDVSSTSCIVLTCSNGSVVAISTLPQSPYLTLHSELLPPDPDFEQEQIIDVSLCLRDCITADMHSEWDDYTVVPPFGRIQWPKQAPTRIMTDRDRINHTAVEFSKNSIYSGPQSNCIAFSLTAGNAVESQILRHRIYQTIERIVTEKGLSASSSITSALARMMADQNQQRTQILSNGRIMAASAILIEFATKMNHNTNEKRSSTSTIYQIDPSGQYWICQAVVSGRYASKIEQELQNRLRERSDRDSTPHHHQKTKSAPTTEPLSRHQVGTLLAQLSIDDALTMATQSLLAGTSKRKGAHDDHRPSKMRLRGIVVSTNSDNDVSIQTLSHCGLLSRLNKDIHKS